MLVVIFYIDKGAEHTQLREIPKDWDLEVLLKEYHKAKEEGYKPKPFFKHPGGFVSFLDERGARNSAYYEPPNAKFCAVEFTPEETERRS